MFSGVILSADFLAALWRSFRESLSLLGCLVPRELGPCIWSCGRHGEHLLFLFFKCLHDPSSAHYQVPARVKSVLSTENSHCN